MTPATTDGLLRVPGVGRIYRPVYRDRRTGERRLTDTLYLEHSHQGRQVRESAKTRDLRVARRLLLRRAGAKQAGQYIPAADRVTVDDLLRDLVSYYEANQLRSLRRLRVGLVPLRAAFGGWKAHTVTTTALTAYQTRRQQTDGVSPATVNRELAFVRRAFRLAVRARTLAQAPYVPMLRESAPRQGFVEVAELDALCAALPDYLRPLVRFLFLTGWREGEARGLGWSNVDFVTGTVRLEVGTTKNRDGREFPFAALPALGELLRAQRERVTQLERRLGRVIPSVFPGASGDPIVSFRTAWRTACRRAGLRTLPHDLRRSAVRRLERAGVPRSVAMKLVGHKTESVYRRYAIVASADLAAGVEKLAALHARETAGAERVVVPMAERARVRSGGA